MKIRDWIEMLGGMDPNLEAWCMYETAAGCVLNALPTPNGIVMPSTPVDELPNPVQVLRDLFEAGGLEDHFYAVREHEGLGWEGPRMLKWGAACEAARKLMNR